MRQLDLEDLAFDIRNLDTWELIRAADRVMREGEALRRHIEARLPRLVATSRRTTELVSELLPRHKPQASAPRSRGGQVA